MTTDVAHSPSLRVSSNSSLLVFKDANREPCWDYGMAENSNLKFALFKRRTLSTIQHTVNSETVKRATPFFGKISSISPENTTTSREFRKFIQLTTVNTHKDIQQLGNCSCNTSSHQILTTDD